MNVHREGHSSCSIDGNLYVFCGINSNKQPINSIEVLDDACSALDLIQRWREITVSQDTLVPRWMAACVPINED
jgi:N-acetylneuraminic acid mutarotase|eukprot:CAMPEP_0185579094 /NCGR_PEP_ID=MMETSP0434-20130131/13529_1 /TAXON_ID=626734 ORGANISM="Favella taraikaensis, Strain Fe Narragansett Bay" /NCGR_SAMPLE_ID=MMETSP0434 /ASSEMBLY_ACC=CAM_ASM_000379 /LENGTH=73 /DNA_ID=CAMNT_0028197045 /DNA_START=581 /DNA_END=802 /DNA_ORIENTATION=+